MLEINDKAVEEVVTKVQAELNDLEEKYEKGEVTQEEIFTAVFKYMDEHPELQHLMLKRIK